MKLLRPFMSMYSGIYVPVIFALHKKSALIRYTCVDPRSISLFENIATPKQFPRHTENRL